MKGQDINPINFELDDSHRHAIETSASQEIRFSSGSELGEEIETLNEEQCKGIVGGAFSSFVACNQAFASFVACNQAFASFVACNQAFNISKNTQYLGKLLS